MSQPRLDRNAHLAAIRPDLDACGLPWRALNGKRHIKVFIRERLALVISHGKGGLGNQRVLKNARAHIRRAVKELS